MRRMFHEHYRISRKDVDALWKEGLVVLDTNVLLNLYRYPEKGRAELLKVLHEFQQQLWLPNRVAFEYHQRRSSVIEGQYGEYSELTGSFERILEKLESARRHPPLCQHA